MTEERATNALSPDMFDQLYQGRGMDTGIAGVRLATIPWRIDGPQPLIVELADTGQITGPVLESGCGLGDNALFLAARGYPVTAFDVSPTVIEQNRAKAAERGAAVEFLVADATTLDGFAGEFRTVLDCAMLHCLTDDKRRAYLAALCRVCRPGARLHILCFPETVAGAFPLPGSMDETSLRRDLDPHWHVEHIALRRYTTSLSASEWRATRGMLSLALDTPDSADEQGRVVVPVRHIVARLR